MGGDGRGRRAEGLVDLLLLLIPGGGGGGDNESGDGEELGRWFEELWRRREVVAGEEWGGEEGFRGGVCGEGEHGGGG